MSLIEQVDRPHSKAMYSRKYTTAGPSSSSIGKIGNVSAATAVNPDRPDDSDLSRHKFQGQVGKVKSQTRTRVTVCD